jgi:hypothetical protein
VITLLDIDFRTLADAPALPSPGPIAGLVDDAQIYSVASQYLAGNASYANPAFYWLVREADGPVQDGGVMIYVDALLNSHVNAVLRADKASTGVAYTINYPGSGLVVIQVDTGGTQVTIGTVSYTSTPTPGVPCWLLFRTTGLNPCTIQSRWWPGNGGVPPDPNSAGSGSLTFTDTTGSVPGSRAGFPGTSTAGGTSHVQRLLIVKDAPPTGHPGAKPKWCPPLKPRKTPRRFGR